MTDTEYAALLAAAEKASASFEATWKAQQGVWTQAMYDAAANEDVSWWAVIDAARARARQAQEGKP